MIEFDVDMGYLLDYEELDKVVLNDENGEHEPMEFVPKDAATVGNPQEPSDAVIERIERFCSDYAQCLVDATLHDRRPFDEVDHRTCESMEAVEAKLIRELAEDIATVGAGTCHTVYLVEVSDDLIESWHPIGVYLHRESAENCAKALRREEDGIRQFARVVELSMEGAGTCIYVPDESGFTWWDENDVEHYEEYSASDECGSASCDKCGYTMMVGDDGWFDGWDEITDWWEEDGSYHKGYILKPRFKHCPNCGRRIEVSE